MSSILKAAWRVVVRRSRSDLAVLVAVFITTLLAVGLLAAGPIYAEATTTSSLRRALADAPVQESSVVIETRVDPSTYEPTDEEVGSAVTSIFGPEGATMHRRGTTDSFALTGIETTSDNDLVVFRSYTGIDSRVAIEEGSPPANVDGEVQVMLSTPAAEMLNVSAGSRFTATSRLDPSLSFPVHVTAIYEPLDRTDPYWLGDELDLEGRVESGSFSTIGPLVVTPETYFASVGSASSKLRWSVFPEHQAIEVEDVPGLTRGVAGLEDDLNAGRELGNQVQVHTGLDTILKDTERALLVTRTAVLTVSIQLAILAAYALLLAAGLLADTREIESNILRSRGASPRQLTAMAAMEGAIVALPAFLLGPYLAAAAVNLFNELGPLAEIGLEIEPSIEGGAWTLAAVAALGCIVALVVPAHLATRQSGSVRARRARATKQGRRYAMDIALLAVAAIGLWQLNQYGTAITTTVRGGLGIDPLLVAAPALALLAGAILALRLLPLLSHLAERLTVRRRGLMVSLGVWHLSRQPRSYARSALMLIIALSIGVFAVSYSATWRKSQSEQADFIVGADIDVAPSRAAGAAIAPEYLIDAYSRLPGYEGAAATLRSRGELAGANKPIEFLMLDATSAGDLLLFREDLSAQPVSQLMGDLVRDRPTLEGVTLPEGADALAVTIGFDVEEPDSPVDSIPQAFYAYEPSLRAVLVDARGLTFRVDFGEIPRGSDRVQMRAFINSRAELDLSPQQPVSVVGLELRGLAPIAGLQQKARLQIQGFGVSTTGGATWMDLDILDSDPTGTVSDLRLAVESPTIGLDDRDVLTIRIDTGSSSAQNRPEVYHAVWVGALPDITSLPVIADTELVALLDEVGSETVPLEDLPEFDGVGKLVAEVEAFPTVDPNRSHVVIADLATYLMATLAAGSSSASPTGFWLDLEPDDPLTVERAEAELANQPFSSASISTRDSTHRMLSLDPVALGIIGSLLAGLVAAAVLAGIGFLVNVIVTSRQRLGQFALMKAVGLRTKQILRWVATENLVTVGFGVTFGILVGIGLANLILPLTAVTADATEVVPSQIVELPWAPVVGLILLGGLLVTAAGLIVRRAVRGLEVSALLRGDE